MNVTVYAAQGTATDWAQGIEQGISEHVAAIDLFAVDPTQVIPQLRDAKAAHIPVILEHVTQDGLTPPASVKGLYAAQVTTPFDETGRLSVDYAVASTGTATDALIINSAEFPPSNGIVAAIKAEFAKVCATCKYTVVNVPIVNWATQIQSTIQSQISADPNINWVLPLYDSESQFAAAGITAAGRAGDVHIATYNGTPFVLQLMEQGNIVAMDSAENTNWLGYAGMDETFRVLLGVPPAAEHTPLRIIDKSNVAQTGTPPQIGKGLGTAYLTGYHRLWGIQG
jgi:ribose transport system substrate-binding protein